MSDKCSQTPIAEVIDAQGIANLLWAMAVLLDNGLELTPELKEVVATLLSCVNDQEYHTQDFAKLLCVMAKLVDNRLDLTPELKEALDALLLNAQKDFLDAHIDTLQWAMERLVDNGLELTPELQERVWPRKVASPR